MVRTLSPDKRENLLRSALKLFVANGVQNTSTAEIAREAGIAAGTLFIYFPTKQDLINELLLKLSKEQSDRIYSILDQPLAVRDTFFTIWKGSIDWLIENIEAYQFIRQVRDSGVISQEIVLESAKYFLYYYEAIQKGLQEALIKPYPVDLIGGILYQDIIAVMEAIKSQPDLSFQDEVIRMGFEIFWNGIKR